MSTSVHSVDPQVPAPTPSRSRDSRAHWARLFESFVAAFDLSGRQNRLALSTWLARSDASALRADLEQIGRDYRKAADDAVVVLAPDVKTMLAELRLEDRDADLRRDVCLHLLAARAAWRSNGDLDNIHDLLISVDLTRHTENTAETFRRALAEIKSAQQSDDLPSPGDEYARS